MLHDWFLLIFVLLAMGWDVRFRKIPNVLILVGFFGILVGIWVDGGLWGQGLSFFCGLLWGITLFKIGFWGGGDAKLFAVVSLGIPMDYWINFLFIVLIFGGIEALIFKVFFKKEDGIPYAMAIGGGMLVCLFL